MEKKYDFEKDFQDYSRMLAFVKGDVPLEVLCLSKTILSVLHREGFTRVNELLAKDISTIKGLGISRIGDLTTSLNKFFSIEN